MSPGMQIDPKSISVSGTGLPNFVGGYTGLNIRTYVLKMTSGGTTGTAEYEWWNKNDPFTIYPGITTTGERELEEFKRRFFDLQTKIEDSDEKRARTLINEVLSNEPGKNKIKWKCSECGEEVEDQFSDCWNCGKSRFENM